MYHTAIGNFGHFFVITAFVTALVATYAYFKSSVSPELSSERSDWAKFGRWTFIFHSVSVVAVVFCLYWIILNNYFEYHYAWKNTSVTLPLGYAVSSFWQNQEGSFLVWIFWNMVLGLILVFTNKTWEGPVMAVFALVQAFLASMVLGVIIPGIDLKIGSTPFLLLKEALPDLPVWKMDPNFIPKDGQGLNPTLQNYWMVIHPPTLFLGFSSTLVPFSFAVAGLALKKTTDWIRPALPWTLFSALILGVGILMGAIWAYETLSFGGYWNWDPVENTSFVPWLILIGAIHTMIIARRNASALKAALILSITGFLLVLYSTFMTRSGILGDASVHSFTDLGLSGQLLIYMFTFVFVAFGLLAYRWKSLPTDEEEVSTYSQEFWMFIGAVILCLSGFQILFTTSFPVYNKIAEVFGVILNLAAPTDAVAHFNKFQLWFFALVVVLTGIGQYFWWKKVGKDNWKALYIPFLVTLVISSIGIVVGRVQSFPFIILLTASIFAVVTNTFIFAGIVKNNYKLSGGAITHIGVGLMLIGILFSSGYTKVVSLNTSGLLISREDAFTKNDNKENKENITLWYNRPERMGDYMVTYRDIRVEPRDMPGYIPRSWVEKIDNDYRAVALRDLAHNEKVYYKKGDTLELFPENFYYEIEYRDPSGKVFSLFPRIQISGGEQITPSPDIKMAWNKDMYTYLQMVSSTPDAEVQWAATEDFTVSMRDTFFINDYVAILDNVVRTENVDGVALAEGDAAVKALIRVLDKEREYVITPSFIIRNSAIGRKPEINKELGLRVQFKEINPKTGQFTFSLNTARKEYVVMKAIEKPMINLLWIGTIVLIIGFIMATVRRFQDFAKSRDREETAKQSKVARKSKLEVS